jgi:hypothetical protein
MVGRVEKFIGYIARIRCEFRRGTDDKGVKDTNE